MVEAKDEMPGPPQAVEASKEDAEWKTKKLLQFHHEGKWQYRMAITTVWSESSWAFPES